MFVGLAAYRSRKRYDGELRLLFALGYLWSTWGLEHRQRPVSAARAAVSWRRMGQGLTAVGQPFRALFTARRISWIVAVPLRSASAAGHADSGRCSRAILIMITSSSIVTSPELSQSPTQSGAGAVGVALG